ncbi:MAG TPA: N-acetylmuramidase domain-containing protein [Candidatus Binatia bacterium]|nr:N-acetylmuramidase domain-containing protein [Candidatus Binatia bacterium]
MGQVMGFNHEAAGFKSAAAMVRGMVKSEDAQLAGMARFLKANGLAVLLRKKDWTGFAKGYDGPHYWQNRYV